MNTERHRLVKEIFLEAGRLVGERREEFLRNRCGDDTELRSDVESLLEYHLTQTILTRARTLDDTQTLANVARTRTEGSLPVIRFLRKALSNRRAAPGSRRTLILAGVLAALVLGAIGWMAHSAIEISLRNMRASELEILLESNVAAIQLWMNHERARVTSWARDPDLRQRVEELATAKTDGSDPAAQSPSSEETRIREILGAVAGADMEILIWDRTYDVLTDSFAGGDSPELTDTGAAVLSRVFAGETLLRMPHHGRLTRAAAEVDPGSKSNNAESEAEYPRFSIVAPLRSLNSEKIIAALMLSGIGSEEEFHRILTRVRAEESGETYAFDARGVMISESRFTEQLKRIGLIPDRRDARSSMVVQIRDPGGDLTRGYKPDRPLPARPLTRMAAFATAGKNGLDLDGCRDYRGIPVICAWAWLPNHEFGVVTEIDYDEAYAPLRYLNVAFGVVFGLLTIAVGTILFSSVSIVRLREEVSASQKLGQYELERRIGEGGMGDVYLARHLLLKRPTAVKLLKPGVVNARTQAWFEREVRLVSQLTHPNTIQVYDYGRTPDGLFYYAMEYLDGLNLSQLVEMEGALPPSRAIHILQQACQSLREAHGMGLVHRDIKPHNIMICRRAGEADFVKLLDFGLVKELDRAGRKSQITTTSALAGTPLYMSPERLRNPLDIDARADIYALGGVGFKLLTGRDVFRAKSEADVLDQVLHSNPLQPSQVTVNRIPEELDELIVTCLAKDPSDRPQSVTEVLVVLNSIRCDDRWGQTDAQRWWDRHVSDLSDYRRSQDPTEF